MRAGPSRSGGSGAVQGGRWARLSIALLGVLLAGQLVAQQEMTVPQGPDEKYTLHVYSDLVQVPTLVLNALHGTYGGLDARDFKVQIDSGPPFRPRHVHMEGDDPITFGLLLDVSHTETNALPAALDWALSKFHDEVLGPHDFVSVFAFDCNLIRTADDAPASNSEMRAAVLQAMKSPVLRHESAGGGRCKESVHLWDAVGFAAGQLRQYPGRRVLVVISDGVDRGSKNSWKAVRQVLTGFSVTAFGIRPAVLPIDLTANGVRRNQLLMVNMEDPFTMLCGGSGGLLTDSNQETLAPLLGRIVELVRGRYILEFPRPTNGTSGAHRIDVVTSDRRAIVRITGATFPVVDKTRLSDPTTVPSDPNRAPVQGDRRIIKPD